MLHRFEAVVLMASLVATGCAKSSSKQGAPSASAHTVSPPVSASAASAISSATAIAPQSAAQLLEAWTHALNAADMPALESLYADSVRFYGTSLKRAEVIARKRKALAAAPGFSQQVVGPPSFSDDGEHIRVGFQKRSGIAGAQSDVRSTLVLVKAPRLAIEEETDAVTEKRLERAAAEKPDNCDEAVWSLADSTRIAKRLYAVIDRNLEALHNPDDLHRGGMGPFLPSETDGTYQVWIGVQHPDRFENYGVFSVTPSGAVSVYSGELSLDNQRADPTPSALEDFKRLCPSK